MTAERLLDCIGLLDDKYICEAENYSPAKQWKKIYPYISIAACFIVIVVSVILISGSREDIITAPDVTDTEMTATSETEVSESTSVSEDVIIETTMPEPFITVPEGGGDENADYYRTVNHKLDYIDMSFVNYVGIDEFEEWINSSSSFSSDLTAVDELANLYSLIVHFDIPKETAREILHAIRIEVSAYVSFELTDEEIELLLSRDNEKIAEHFVSEFSIAKGKNIYSVKWLYTHSVNDYYAAGITPDDILSRTELYSQILFTDEARKAFSEKLSEFTGQSVVLTAPVIAPKPQTEAIEDILVDADDEEVEVIDEVIDVEEEIYEETVEEPVW